MRLKQIIVYTFYDLNITTKWRTNKDPTSHKGKVKGKSLITLERIYYHTVQSEHGSVKCWYTLGSATLYVMPEKINLILQVMSSQIYKIEMDKVCSLF